MQMKSTLLISVILLAIATGQVFSRWGDDRYTVLVIVFGIGAAFAAVAVFTLIMDIVRKDFRTARGIVYSRHRNQVWVKLDTGKHQSCVISADQKPEHFVEGQAVELMLGRRSKMVHRIRPVTE